jgi:hypothetical protein
MGRLPHDAGRRPTAKHDPTIPFSVHEVVVLLGIGRDAAYQLLRRHGFRVGHRLRIGITELAQVMAQSVEREEDE